MRQVKSNQLNSSNQIERMMPRTIGCQMKEPREKEKKKKKKIFSLPASLKVLRQRLLENRNTEEILVFLREFLEKVVD
jgi:hypothetical protein